MTTICTVVTDDFVPGFEVMRHSFLEHHADVEHTLVIVHHPELAPLSESNRRDIAERHPGVEFRVVSSGEYGRVNQQRDTVLETPDRLRPAFVILDAFTFDDDHVVCLDSDLLFLRPAPELFASGDGFAAVPALDHNTGGELGYFNTGVMTIGPSLLGGATYESILSEIELRPEDRSVGKADQAVLNRWFGDEFRSLPQRLNVTKRFVPGDRLAATERLRRLDAAVLHFVGEKPWNAHQRAAELRYRGAERLWWDAARRVMPGPLLESVVSERLRQLETLAEAG